MGNSLQKISSHQAKDTLLDNSLLDLENPQDVAVQGCVFCELAQQGSVDDRLIFENERIVAFPDIAPAALEHFLVVPKTHIKHVKSVKGSDLELIQEMHDVGKRLLNERRPQHKHQLGYHVPPFNSINHLHLHCFALPFQPWIKKIKYILPCVYISATDFESQLRHKADD